MIKKLKKLLKKKYKKGSERSTFTLEQLEKKLKEMTKEDLTSLLYKKTKDMQYKDVRVNKIKFLKIGAKYYINYELIFFNLIQIAPNYRDFAMRNFSFNPKTSSISFNDQIIQEYYNALCKAYSIDSVKIKREYKTLSINCFYFKENLLQIPKEIASLLEVKGVKFKCAREGKKIYSSKYYDFFYMSHKYITFQDNAQ